MDWINVAQYRDKWLILVKVVMNCGSVYRQVAGSGESGNEMRLRIETRGWFS